MALVGAACTSTPADSTTTSIEESASTTASASPTVSADETRLGSTTTQVGFRWTRRLPDFDQIFQRIDQIALSDGDTEACQAWVGWEYRDDFQIDVERDESTWQSFDLEYVLADALQDFAECITLGWGDYKQYRRCISDVEPRDIVIDNGNTFTGVFPTEADLERCRAEATLSQ